MGTGRGCSVDTFPLGQPRSPAGWGDAASQDQCAAGCHQFGMPQLHQKARRSDVVHG